MPLISGHLPEHSIAVLLTIYEAPECWRTFKIIAEVKSDDLPNSEMRREAEIESRKEAKSTRQRFCGLSAGGIRKKIQQTRQDNKEYCFDKYQIFICDVMTFSLLLFLHKKGKE